MTDTYEQKYMVKAGHALHTYKRRAPTWMQLLLASTPLTGLMFLAFGEWIAAALLLIMGVVVWGLFAVLRVTVTDEAIAIQYGLFGPRIPLRAIESAEAVDYDWRKFGGWGVRRSADGAAMYNVPGDGGRAVRVSWTDERGKQRVTYVGMPEPEPTLVAIESGIRALPASDRPALPDADDEPH